MWHPGETHVLQATSADLRVVEDRWAFALRHADAIAAHWARRTAQTPGFFNGAVHLLSAVSLDVRGHLAARFVRTDFASFLYWRETGWRDASVMDAFGTALILASDGRLLLGEQRGGNLNGGLVYPPSGFIDPADIAADGRIDIDGSVLREVCEETGLAATDLAPLGGYVLTFAGPVLSIGVPLGWRLSGDALVARVSGHIAADPGSELARVLAVPPAPPETPMPDYVRALLPALARLKTRP